MVGSMEMLVEVRYQIAWKVHAGSLVNRRPDFGPMSEVTGWIEEFLLDCCLRTAWRLNSGLVFIALRVQARTASQLG